MNVCGQYFSQSVLDRIRELIRAEPLISLLDLSRRVCEWLNWRSASGRLQDMSCRKALAKLNSRGILDLPRREKTYGFERSTVNQVKPDIAEISCTLGEVSSGCWAIKCRDEYIGWTEAARKRVEWYSGRWGIEVYHRTLKSGCRIKDRQLGTADRLETCLAIDMVVAWRIYHLTMLGRETPDMPCTVFFKDVEWKALCCYVKKMPIPPEKPPSLREAIYMTAALGGHLGRKGDGFPGTQTLWRGLQRLDTATEMYVIFTQQHKPHPLQSGP